MRDRPIGFETEYEFAVLGAPGSRLDVDAAASRFIRLVATSFPSLPSAHTDGVFLSNGGLLLKDAGSKIEYSTPETMSPFELATYVIAGHRIVAGIASQMVSSTPELNEVILSRCNVSYSGCLTTWAAHESYLTKLQLGDVRDQLIPHLVSRQIYTGAGGFDPRAPGLEFTISPRLTAHVGSVASESSTHARGIFHEKDEPLCCRPYRRLHILAGDNLCSETAIVLKAGTTALILALCEAGIRPGNAVMPESPVGAMRQFCSDTGLRTTVPLSSGRRASALEIQEHYLRLVRDNMHRASMPDWAPDLVSLWEDTLVRLYADQESLSGRLDWAIKKALFEEQMRRRGYDQGSLQLLNTSLRETYSDVCRMMGTRDYSLQNAIELARSMDDPVRTQAIVNHQGLQSREIRDFLQFRSEMMEFDTRFGQVNGAGIFDTLDREGVLDHAVPGVSAGIESAMATPPPAGRAKARGEWVKQLGGKPGVTCDWQVISDNGRGCYLDMSDPWKVDASWSDFSADDDDVLGRDSALDRLLRPLRRRL